MKKILALSFLALAFVFIPTVADKAHAAECGDGIVVDTVRCDNGDPAQNGMQWGLTGAQTPTFAMGTTIADEVGIVYDCPTWLNPGYGRCYDITGTGFYKNSMINLAKDLVAKNIAPQFPRFGPWVAKVK